MEDRVMYLAFCRKDVIILIGLGTQFYCHYVVCTRLAGNEQELWESATFHSKPNEYYVYQKVNDNSPPQYRVWQKNLTIFKLK